MNSIIAGSAQMICIVGILLAIYTLITTKLDTRRITYTLLVCFTGLGWLFVYFHTVKASGGGLTLGLAFFLLSYIIWLFKLNDLKYKTIFKYRRK